MQSKKRKDECKNFKNKRWEWRKLRDGEKKVSGLVKKTFKYFNFFVRVFKDIYSSLC